MRESVKTALNQIGLRIERISEEERLLRHGYDPRHAPDASELQQLSPDNPRLIALQNAYRNASEKASASNTWASAEQSTAEDLRFFRGDNLYLWQYTRSPQHNAYRSFIYGKYVQSADSFELLGRTLTEDGSYGCFTFDFAGMPTLSRDLLDSVNELTFLGRHVGLFDTPGRQILDIGAGYGRLAQRALTAAANVAHYWCVDAVARSTFLCEYFVNRHGLTDRATVLPVHEIDSLQHGLPSKGIDLAINVHSFSEMPLAAIESWIATISSREIRYLFVVPNERDQLLSREADGARIDCASHFRNAGYRLVVNEPAIRDEAVRDILDLHDHFLLFERA